MRRQETEAAPSTTRIGFDDVALGGGWTPVPDGYAGFRWQHLAAYELGSATVGSGYEYGITSGDQAAYALSAEPVTMALPRGTFTLRSVDLTAAWDSQLTVEVYGYQGGSERYHVTLQINDKAPTHVDLGFEHVHRVVFVASGGVDDPLLDGVGEHIVFDTFRVSDLVQRPEPLLDHAPGLTALV